MTPASPPSLPKNWSTLDFGLHALLAVTPFALGLWMFSLAPLVGGNLFVAALISGIVAFLGALVIGSLAQRFPVTGADYTWQTRVLGPRVGAIATLTSWWLAVTLLAPVYGNLLLVQVIDPLLAYGGVDKFASWFRGREGIFTCSLIAIAIATVFVGMGMRWAARVQRGLVVIGAVGLVAFLGLLFSGGPAEFRDAFDNRSSELYGASPLASSQIVDVGSLDARVTEVEPLETLRLVPVVLLFSLWIGWAAPLAGEIRARKPDAIRAALVRVAFASTLLSLLFFVAIGRGNTWPLWNEANNLYWGTVYDTTPATPLATWPNPVVFATWLTDSAFLQYGTIVAMSAWVIGATATLFLPATRVLLAAGIDAVLPRRVARTTQDGVPRLALALLVVPACGFAALDAYWSWFAAVTAVAVVALGITMAGSAVAGFTTFRRSQPALAAVCAGFVLLVGVVIGAWVFDSVYGMRRFATLGFLLGLYATATLVYTSSLRRARAPLEAAPDLSG